MLILTTILFTTLAIVTKSELIFVNELFRHGGIILKKLIYKII